MEKKANGKKTADKTRAYYFNIGKQAASYGVFCPSTAIAMSMQQFSFVT